MNESNAATRAMAMTLKTVAAFMVFPLLSKMVATAKLFKLHRRPSLARGLPAPAREALDHAAPASVRFGNDYSCLPGNISCCAAGVPFCAEPTYCSQCAVSCSFSCPDFDAASALLSGLIAAWLDGITGERLERIFDAKSLIWIVRP